MTMRASPEELRKTLNRPEARHRYWHVLKEDRNFFPDAYEIFKLEFDGTHWEYEIEVRGPNSNIKGWKAPEKGKEVIRDIERFINDLNGVQPRELWREYLLNEAIDQDTRELIKELGL